MLHTIHVSLIPAIWLAWLAIWIAMAFNAAPEERRETPGQRWLHFGPMVVAGYLMASHHFSFGPLAMRLWARREVLFWIGAGLTATGIGWAVWARVHLGRNWSGAVTLKAGHELIRSGPYAITRHPIYTGLVLAILGTVITQGEVRSFISLTLIVVSLLFKMKREEAWMIERFGDAYRNYQRQVRRWFRGFIERKSR